MRCFFYNHVNKETTQHFVNLITSFLSQVAINNHYIYQINYLYINVVSRGKLGKIMVRTKRFSKLTKKVSLYTHKLTKRSWCLEWDTMIFFNIIKPLLICQRIGNELGVNLAALSELITTIKRGAVLNYSLSFE